ncbi:hypothetical protein L484_010495 [Morus notabilis]|uniref:Transmembrane protein n=1 Tax=Morus notabilis TaxID=981085 RepID=W9QPJ9_9ROSA|nr:hypothetical protein L484_010495 [Morus notabilis]
MDKGIKDSKEISHDRVTKEREFEDDCCIHLVLFTAGTAVLMACLKKVLVVFLLEKWRAWVFVLLNLVLLAILFTSTLSKPKESQKESNNVEVMKIERSKKLRRKHSKCSSEQVIKLEESEECLGNYHQQMVAEKKIEK